MIHSIQFNSGYPARLPGIGKKAIEFNDRLNLLIGPNGAGKSTVLKALAEAAGCQDGGWSENSAAKETDGKKDTGFREKTIAGTDEINIKTSQMDYTVKYDSKPVFFQDFHADSDKSFLNPFFFDEYRYLRSTGEKRIGLINELINHLEDNFLTWKLKNKDKPTIILDEIDNHVGFAGQSILWKEIFPYLVKKYQLIISTHSIFPLLLKRDSSLRQDNVISLHEKYDHSCIDVLADAVDYYNKNRAKIINPSC